jgi:hypothetical protein
MNLDFLTDRAFPSVVCCSIAIPHAETIANIVKMKLLSVCRDAIVFDITAEAAGDTMATVVSLLLIERLWKFFIAKHLNVLEASNSFLFDGLRHEPTNDSWVC